MSAEGVEARWAVIPNLGGEEGADGRAYRRQAPVRAAAHLFLLLFGRRARLWPPPVEGDAGRTPIASIASIARDTLWPAALGPAPDGPVFDWLGRGEGPTAWYASEEAARFAREILESDLVGPSPDSVAACHDKAFAIEATRNLGLGPRSLIPLHEILSPEELREPDRLLKRLAHALDEWPAWCEGRFTFKPRFGSSGRGRIGGRDQVDTPSIRGGLPRLADRGGAIFEPWLDRLTDLSVSLLVPEAGVGATSGDSLPTMLGSLEMWTSPSGVYRGHCGEVDSRGRVFSGDPQDESLRADAAAVAAQAQARGFFGPCGIDAFRYREPASPTPVERVRPLVEFNARPTMGLVTIGLVRRALPRVREALALTPGDRRGFALTYLDRDDRDWRERFAEGLGDDSLALDLSAATPARADTDADADASDPRPVLAFARDPEIIRAARSAVFRC